MNVTLFRSWKQRAAAISAALLAVTFAAAPAAAATTAVASYTTTINGDSADVYYPTTGTRLSVALFLQGANVDKSHYSTYASTLASYGFVVAVPNHTRSLFGVSGLYPEGAQAGWAVDWADAEDDNPASPLYKRINENELVLAGHSFGAATALSISAGLCIIPFCAIANIAPSELEAVVTYGGNNVLYGTDLVLPVLNTVPVGYIQGTADGVATTSEGQTTYNLTAGTPKAFIQVAGTNHYGITNGQNPAGALPDASAQTLNQAVGVETIARWSAQWLLAQTGDSAAKKYVYTTGDAADANVTVTYVK
ncbi:alpha/beta hydrolase family protein [Actinoplanes sp. CA-015351]|uniref:alpha/beta hydrolase family protein n=1 Tax=Actinoplanes sp. CA-015351 TaxID=3239897 RepID=UPI003D95D9B5